MTSSTYSPSQEHAELHARVLDEVAGDDLALALGLVEGDALGLGGERREEEEEREGLDEDAPGVARPASSTMSLEADGCRRS